MYGVFNWERLRSSLYLVVSCFNFRLSFYPRRNFKTLIRPLTKLFIWCNKALYTITDKDVDENTLILRMFFVTCVFLDIYLTFLLLFRYKSNKFKRNLAEVLHNKHERNILNVQEQSVPLKLFN